MRASNKMFAVRRMAPASNHFGMVPCSPLSKRLWPRSRVMSSVAPHHLQTSVGNVEQSTGLIEKKPGEALIYFDNMFPVRFNLWDPRHLLTRIFLRRDLQAAINYIKENAVPPDLPIELEELIPRPKDGGAIVKFKITGDITEEAAERRIQEYVESAAVRPWFNPFQFLRSFRVKGVPWVEDLHRFPSSRLRVEFEGPDVSQETLYFYFRRYGLIRDIIALSPASKDIPRYAMIQFVRLRSAASARNCLHGLVAPNGTKLHIVYEPTIQKHIFRDWFYNHPRIALPALAALVAAISVVVFDPIRTWFIKQKITRRFSLAENSIVRWLRNATASTLDAIVSTGSLGRYIFSKKTESDLQIGFSDRRDIADQLKALLNEIPETFIVVQGPRGSGKVELVREHVVKDRPNTLIIDCKKIMETRSDSAFIKEISTQVGYFPVFPWMNNISGFVDLMVQGVIGQKAGFSESIESQFKNILENAASALKKIVVETHEQISNDSTSSSNAADDDIYDNTTGERPVVVIEHFLYRAERNEAVYKIIADWAAVLVSARVAQVVFVTDDVSYSKILTEALPNQVFNTITVGDATPEHARKFVLQQILSVTGEKEEEVSEEVLKDLDRALEPLGGRMTDLLALVRRITVGGENNRLAAEDMIRQSSSEIIKRFLTPSEGSTWTKEQAWVIIKELASKDDIRYNELALNPLFKNGGNVISALEHAELITVLVKNGRPNAIKAGRPIYRAAFQRLTNDKGLAASMDISTYTSINKVLEAAISKDEDELAKLATILMTKQAVVDVYDRIRYLSDDIRTKQAKISEFEKAVNAQKKVLTVEY